MDKFEAYVWEFYGPHKIYGDFFGHSLTRAEVKHAVALRRTSPQFEGDSIDREFVRDILMTSRQSAAVTLGIKTKGA